MCSEFNIDQDALNQFLRDRGLKHYQTIWKVDEQGKDRFLVVRDDVGSFECIGKNMMDLLMSALNTYFGPNDDGKQDRQKDEEYKIITVTEDARFIYELIQYMLIQSEDLSIDKIASSIEEKDKTNGKKYKKFINELVMKLEEA